MTFKKLIFLDYDGVMTSIKDNSSYISCGDGLNYKMSDVCKNNLHQLINETNSKIVLTTNWTRLENRGYNYWMYGAKKILNPLPLLREEFKNDIIDQIPPIKGLPKAHRLILWFEDNNISNFNNYVIFDDDLEEEFQTTTDYDISNHFIRTDRNNGLTKEDIEKAKNFLV